jgi:hypothetical protein
MDASGLAMWAFPAPIKGKGGKYLILPPDYEGPVPEGYLTFRSRTFGVMVLLRGFFKDPKLLSEPVKVMEQTRFYPLGKESATKPMQYPDASATPSDMLYPMDGTAYDMLSRFIDHEYVDPVDMEMRGMLAGIVIVKGQPFSPDASTRDLLDKAARTASRMGRAIGYEGMPMIPGFRYYPDRQWINPSPGNADFTADTFNNIDAQTGFFTFAFSVSPGMAIKMENIGAKYPAAYVDSDGSFLRGEQAYVLHLPANIPAEIFWSITLYDPITASELNNGQPFPQHHGQARYERGRFD